MSIRLTSSCGTCTSLTEQNICTTHNIEISSLYVCDNFVSDKKLNKISDCTTCARFKKDDCKHPDIATIGVLCTSWAPSLGK